MSDLTFVTGNDEKFIIAAEILSTAGLRLAQAKLDIDEVQSEDSEYIAKKKALAAYEVLQKPLIIRDDSWSILGLRGFPGPYMKSINHWFTAEDFIRLTKDLSDRRAVLTQILVYQDADMQKVFTHETHAELLKEAHGNSSAAFETITMIIGDNGMSIAEVVQSGVSHTKRGPAGVWQDFADWYKE